MEYSVISLTTISLPPENIKIHEITERYIDLTNPTLQTSASDVNLIEPSKTKTCGRFKIHRISKSPSNNNNNNFYPSNSEVNLLKSVITPPKSLITHINSDDVFETNPSTPFLSYNDLVRELF